MQITRNSLEQAIRHAESNDLVGRNVAALVKTPQGRSGRPSKSFTLEQAKALLTASEGTRLHAYVVLSLLVGHGPELVWFPASWSPGFRANPAARGRRHPMRSMSSQQARVPETDRQRAHATPQSPFRKEMSRANPLAPRYSSGPRARDRPM